jgi:hypothetical protein
MLGANGLRGSVDLGTLALPALFIAGLLVFVNTAPDSWDMPLRLNVRAGLVVGFALAVALLAISGPSPFLYYQF